MSLYAITPYKNVSKEVLLYSTTKEVVFRNAFYHLLRAYAQGQDLPLKVETTSCNSDNNVLFSWLATEKTITDITEWALQLFNNHYRQNEPSSPVCYAGSRELRAEFLMDIPAANTITKEAIFYYVYAVLHHPAYRNKYALSLKREFPRIPLYNNFHQWAAWGKKLMDLHINYETVAPYPLERKDIVTEPKAGVPTDHLYKAKLKADKEKGEIEIDAVTTLTGIPTIAWDYQLGNRSALEWILDQYKEKRPSDPTIAEHFNNYHFHDYKEQVILLLQRVCTVSVETMKVIGEMP